MVSENPKKPGIVPGIYHQIIFDRPKSEVVPWREPYRRGSWVEEELKDKEVQMLIDNDIVEKSQSPFCNQVVQVLKSCCTDATSQANAINRDLLARVRMQLPCINA